MNTPVDKSQENKSQSIANRKSLAQEDTEKNCGIVDNSSEVAAQRKFLEIANNSVQVKQLVSFQTMLNNQFNSLQMQPAAEGYEGSDEEFVASVVRGEIAPSKEASISVEDNGNILFAIPFTDQKCQIHIHFVAISTPYKENSVLSDGDKARAHVYNNSRKERYICNDNALELIEKCVSVAVMQEAKQQKDIVTHGKLTFRSITALNLALRGDY